MSRGLATTISVVALLVMGGTMAWYLPESLDGRGFWRVVFVVGPLLVFATSFAKSSPFTIDNPRSLLWTMVGSQVAAFISYLIDCMVVHISPLEGWRFPTEMLKSGSFGFIATVAIGPCALMACLALLLRVYLMRGD